YLGDNEALGGRAYLTSYRILFKPHGRNRLVGMSSVFLPNVVQIRQGWFGVTVETRAQAFEFVMWFNGQFVRAAQARQREMGRQEVERLRQLVTAHPDRIGALRQQRAVEAVNRVLSGATTLPDALGELSPADKSTFAELVALFAEG